MRKTVITVVSLAMLLAGLLFVNYWINTQPVWVVTDVNVDKTGLPEKNRQLIEFIETNGQTIAPDYEGVVCTEFVIKVLDKFNRLTPEEKNKIRIITKDNLRDLVQKDSPIIKGVQTALTDTDKGTAITLYEDVKPGDLVQFWNEYLGKEYGHCGIVLESQPNNSISVYSSHPFTGGYGKQRFLWPDKVFFVRLK
jgi:hypothetical protein